MSPVCKGQPRIQEFAMGGAVLPEGRQNAWGGGGGGGELNELIHITRIST